jgi:hypothetical protein
MMCDLDIRPLLRPLHCVCSDDMLLGYPFVVIYAMFCMRRIVAWILSNVLFPLNNNLVYF